jgi:hypothetical protein
VPLLEVKLIDTKKNALVRTDVSEEPSASVIRATRIELGTTLCAFVVSYG